MSASATQGGHKKQKCTNIYMLYSLLRHLVIHIIAVNKKSIVDSKLRLLAGFY